jgi:hypothetical protein
MSQHDFVIANQTANSARLDINSGLQALASNNSGNSAPTTTYANMWWYETDSNLLKIRNESDSAWINVAYVDQSNSVYAILDDTKLVNTSGAQTGLLGGQTQSTWNTGTGTTESLVSPAQIADAIDTYFTANSIGYGQTWQDVTSSRSPNTSYQNTTSRPIQVMITSARAVPLQVSSNSSTWVNVQNRMGEPNAYRNTASPIIPVNYYYKISGTTNYPVFEHWAELR